MVCGDQDNGDDGDDDDDDDDDNDTQMTTMTMTMIMMIALSFPLKKCQESFSAQDPIRSHFDSMASS